MQIAMSQLTMVPSQLSHNKSKLTYKSGLFLVHGELSEKHDKASSSGATPHVIKLHPSQAELCQVVNSLVRLLSTHT